MFGKKTLRKAVIYRQSSHKKDRPPPSSADPAMRRMNAICPYYTMFPLNFPLRRLRDAQKSEWVLDPFCGRGTTVFAGRLLGLACVGIDSNPIAAAITAAKLADASVEDVTFLARAALEAPRLPKALPEGEFWKLCFHPDTLRAICLLRERLLHRCTTAAEVMLRALVLGILHGPLQKGKPTYLSNQMPRTYATKPAAALRYWKANGLTAPSKVDVLDAIVRRAEHTLASTPPLSKGSVYLADSRKVAKFLPVNRKFGWVVTSPPYYGMRTYRPDQWLRNWFLGGPDHVDYTQHGQLAHHGEQFAEELSTVWKAITPYCLPGAKLIVRFGYLPSIPINPRSLLTTSLALAKAGWRVRRWDDAGLATNGKRQSEQFGQIAGGATSEVDLYARLEA